MHSRRPGVVGNLGEPKLRPASNHRCTTRSGEATGVHHISRLSLHQGRPRLPPGRQAVSRPAHKGKELPACTVLRNRAPSTPHSLSVGSWVNQQMATIARITTMTRTMNASSTMPQELTAHRSGARSRRAEQADRPGAVQAGSILPTTSSLLAIAESTPADKTLPEQSTYPARRPALLGVRLIPVPIRRLPAPSRSYRHQRHGRAL